MRSAKSGSTGLKLALILGLALPHSLLAQQPTGTAGDKIKTAGEAPVTPGTPKDPNAVGPTDAKPVTGTSGDDEKGFFRTLGDYTIFDGQWKVSATGLAGAGAATLLFRKLANTEARRINSELAHFRRNFPQGLEGSEVKRLAGVVTDKQVALGERLAALNDTDLGKTLRAHYGGEACAVAIARMHTPTWAAPAVPTTDQMKEADKDVVDAYRELEIASNRLIDQIQADYQRVMGKPLPYMKPAEMKDLAGIEKAIDTTAANDAIRGLFQNLQGYQTAVTPVQKRAWRQVAADAYHAAREAGFKGAFSAVLRSPITVLGGTANALRAAPQAIANKGPQVVVTAATIYLSMLAAHKQFMPTEEETEAQNAAFAEHDKRKDKEAGLEKPSLNRIEHKGRVELYVAAWATAHSRKELPKAFRADSLPFLKDGLADFSVGSLDAARNLNREAERDLSKFEGAKSDIEVAWIKIFAKAEARDVQPGKKHDDLEQEVWKKYKKEIQSIAALMEMVPDEQLEEMKNALQEAEKNKKKAEEEAAAAAEAAKAAPAPTPSGTGPKATPSGTGPAAAPTGTPRFPRPLPGLGGAPFYNGEMITPQPQRRPVRTSPAPLPGAAPSGTAMPKATPSGTPAPSASATGTAAPASTPPTASPTGSARSAATPAATAQPAATPSASPTASPTATAKPAATPSATPTATAKPSGTK
ncbi:hypothetical protein K2X33_07030 [bacterium]|nr:hypothetical protein [bacterium]